MPALRVLPTQGFGSESAHQCVPFSFCSFLQASLRLRMCLKLSPAAI